MKIPMVRKIMKRAKSLRKLFQIGLDVEPDQDKDYITSS